MKNGKNECMIGEHFRYQINKIGGDPDEAAEYLKVRIDQIGKGYRWMVSPLDNHGNHWRFILLPYYCKGQKVVTFVISSKSKGLTFISDIGDIGGMCSLAEKSEESDQRMAYMIFSTFAELYLEYAVDQSDIADMQNGINDQKPGQLDKVIRDALKHASKEGE